MTDQTSEGLPALLATMERGGCPEAQVRGHVVAVSADGNLVAAAGNPKVRLPVRSTVKPIQALPFVSSGAIDRCPDPERALAVACGSHGGEAEHLDTVLGVLAAVGLDESHLWNGPSLPAHAATRRRMIIAGESPRRACHNCSGKHAAMLATCVHMDWPVEGYALRDHPMQGAVEVAFREHAGIDLARSDAGIDGCGLPTYFMQLRELAAGFATAAATSDTFARASAAMRAHPTLVGSSDAFDSAVIAEAAGDLTVKVGAEACWVAVSHVTGTAVAIKLEAGHPRVLSQVALAAIDHFGMTTTPLTPRLTRFTDTSVRNSRDKVVGEVAVHVSRQLRDATDGR